MWRAVEQHFFTRISFKAFDDRPRTKMKKNEPNPKPIQYNLLLHWCDALQSACAHIKNDSLIILLYFFIYIIFVSRLRFIYLVDFRLCFVTFYPHCVRFVIYIYKYMPVQNYGHFRFRRINSEWTLKCVTQNADNKLSINYFLMVLIYRLAVCVFYQDRIDVGFDERFTFTSTSIIFFFFLFWPKDLEPIKITNIKINMVEIHSLQPHHIILIVLFEMFDLCASQFHHFVFLFILFERKKFKINRN